MCMKVLIIGSVASGKSTLAKRLSIENGIKHYEIDSIVHDDLNKRKRSLNEQIKIIENINLSNDWIIEGTLRKNLDMLLDMADLIIYLDVSLFVRKFRILSRFIKQKVGLEKCNYESNVKMLMMMYRWTNDFENNKFKFFEKLNKYNNKLVRLSRILTINNYKL